MKQLLNRVILIGISGLLLTGCKTALSDKKAPKVGAKGSAHSRSQEAAPRGTERERSRDITPAVSTEALAHYATGYSYVLSDKTDLAVDEFYKSALSDPTNESLVIEVSRNLISSKQAQKALDLLSKSAQRPDATASILIWLAQANLHLGQTNQAVSASRAAIAKAPDSAHGYECLFGIYLNSGQFPEMRKVLAQAAKNIKAAPDAYIDLAELHGIFLKSCPPSEQATVKEQGLRILEKSAATKGFPDELLLRLGQAYEHLGEPLKSAEIYLKVLSAEPKPGIKTDALREKLANLYLQAQDKKRAAEQLEAMVRENPTHYPQAWYLLGQLASESKQWADAANHFEKALLLDPAMEQVYYELALVQIDLRRVGDALQTLDRARSKFPNTFAGEFFTGIAYSRLKSYDEALKHYTSAEVIANATEPKRLNEHFYFQVATAYERGHRYEQAVEYFEKCIKIDPEFHEAMNYLGYMWAERGENLVRARELIEKAVKAEPKNAAYLDSLGWVLFKLKQPREALPYLLKAQEFSEEPDATLFDHVGDTYLALQQPEKAREAWKKSLEIEPNDEVKKKLSQLPE